MTAAPDPCEIPSPWQEWASSVPDTPGSLRVWLINVDTDALCHQAGTVLSETETSRAARFSTPLLARRYAGAHAALRRLLAAETGTPARALRFGESARGKPMLLATSGECSPDFNLSHSGPWVLVGVAKGLHIGVDIEEVTQHHDWPLVATEILAPRESSTLHQLPPDRQSEFLIRAWTTKEACLKAMGTGLAVDPRRLVCHPTTGNGVALSLDGQPLEVRCAWNTIGPEFSASIVALAAWNCGSSAGGNGLHRAGNLGIPSPSAKRLPTCPLPR